MHFSGDDTGLAIGHATILAESNVAVNEAEIKEGDGAVGPAHTRSRANFHSVSQAIHKTISTVAVENVVFSSDFTAVGGEKPVSN